MMLYLLLISRKLKGPNSSSTEAEVSTLVSLVLALCHDFADALSLQAANMIVMRIWTSMREMISSNRKLATQTMSVRRRIFATKSTESTCELHFLYTINILIMLQYI